MEAKMKNNEESGNGGIKILKMPTSPKPTLIQSKIQQKVLESPKNANLPSSTGHQ